MSLKMEDLLEAAEKRRQLALDHLRKCGKLDTFSLAGNHYSTHQMEEDDMKEMYNRWRRDIHSWMNENTLTGYRNLKRAGCHSTAQAFVKTAFNTYLVQLSGSRFLLDKLIQLPMVQRPGSLLLSGSAEPPAALQHFAMSLLRCITDLHEMQGCSAVQGCSAGMQGCKDARMQGCSAANFSHFSHFSL